MIYFTSDFHFNHPKPFIYEPRNFTSIAEMNEGLIKNYNSVILPKDDVYVLGDLILGDLNNGIECLKRLNGKLHIVRGNHCTDTRWKAYANLPNVVELENAIYLKYYKQHFYLSHYPTITSNHDYEKPLSQRLLNLCGHSHTKNKWQDIDKGYIYHVEVDAHNNFPVSIDEVLNDFKSIRIMGAKPAPVGNM